jgi:YfiH family protein
LHRKDTNGIVTYHFENLATAKLGHAVFTRLGGVSRGPFSSLNVGNGVGDDAGAVAENHARVFAHLEIDGARVTSPHQVHGNRVAPVGEADVGQTIPRTDGLVTDTPGVGLLLRFADCQPILLYDPAHHALGLVHAGWRGVAQGIAHRAVETMQERFGTQPQDLIVGLGPAIGPCCYTVGQNVAAAMGYALPDWSQVMQRREEGWRLDLSAANIQQLTADGVEEIEEARICTACRGAEFFSHRAGNGRTGRFAVVAYLRTQSNHARIVELAAGQHGPGPEEPPLPDSLLPPGFPPLHESGEGRP